jgi:phosphonate transport system substrate-binding protein
MIIDVEKRIRKLVAVIVTGLLLGTSIVQAQESDKPQGKTEIPSGKNTLVIGKVTSNPQKVYKYLKPIADYVVSHMQDLGVQKAKVLMTKNNDQMIHYLKQGKVDWVTETPFSALLFKDQAGAEMLVRRWKQGVPEYHTVFIVRKDSGISSLNDLKGKTVAFEDPGSTSAYFIPASELILTGLKLLQLNSPREKPPADRVGYIFAIQEINISTWVHKKIVAAGAFSNIDWNLEERTPTAFKEDVRILHRTKPFPEALEMVRKNLDPIIKERMKKILVDAHNDPNAKPILRTYRKTKKFEALDEKVLRRLAELSETRRILQEESE